MTRPRFLAVCLIAALLTPAPMLHANDLVPLRMNYHRITLSNGRILKDAQLSSYNAAAGLVYVLEDRQLKPYPVALFPGMVTDRIRARAAERPPARSGKTADSADSGDTASAPPASTPLNPAAREAAMLRAVAAKAESAARRHFRYQVRTGSGYATVTDVEIEMNEPEAVPGWGGRYRVRGDAYYGFYDSVGGTFNRRARGVEVLLEANDSGRIEVLEVETKWSNW